VTRFNFRANNAAPVVYWSDKEQRMAFGLFCRDISTALFLLAIEKVGVVNAVVAAECSSQTERTSSFVTATVARATSCGNFERGRREFRRKGRPNDERIPTAGSKKAVIGTGSCTADRSFVAARNRGITRRR
jgi:hypothetical protein